MAYSTPGRSRERVFQFVSKRLLQGRPPTIREVQQAMGYRSVESARNHLEALVREGRLVKDPGRSRGYQLGDVPGQGKRPPALVPLVGRVQAGDLNLALETPEGHVPVQTRYAPDELFALTVRGQSMIEAGILHGDLVIVRRQQAADSGDIVVALVGQEATVKKLKIGKKRIELLPANPDFEPIIPDPEQLSILGKVIEVRRNLEN